jgi:PKD repeat protein
MALLRRSCELLVVFCMVSGAFLNVAAQDVGDHGHVVVTPVATRTADTAASRDAGSRSSGPDKALFKDPPMDDRVHPISMDKVDQATRDKLDSLGVGGMVVNSWNWDDAALKDAKAKNWTMWVNDYYMYPSGSANPFGGVHEKFWNPSFETHNLGFWPDGWQWSYSDWPRYDISGSKSHSGSAALSVDSANWFYWMLGVKPGVEYNISAWARQDAGGESGRIIVIWANIDQSVGANVTVFQTGPNYARYSMLARAPPNANVARIIIQGAQRNLYVWYDDVMVRKVDKTITNTMVNRGFETDANIDNIPDGWFPINSPTYDHSGIWAYNGSAAVKVNASNLYAQFQPAVAGKQYYLGEWLVSETATVLGQMAILWLNQSNVIGFSNQVFWVGDIWYYYDFIAEAPATTDAALVVMVSASNSYVWADDVVFYQAPALTDGVSRGPILDGHPELEAQGLYYSSEDILSPLTSNLSVPHGKLVLAVAAPKDANDVLDLTKAVNLTSTVSGGKVKWTPSGGMWRVMAFSYDILFNGTECDPAITNMHQINVMNKVAVQRFIDVMYNQTIYQKTSKYWGNMIEASFTDEVSNLAAYFIKQDRPVVAWLHDDVNKLHIEGTFQKLHGYDLVAKLPALWNDVGPRTVKYRIDFYNTTAYLQGEAYYKMIGDWCHDHGINFSGHQLAEDSLLSQVAFYGDYFESAKHMGYPGIDALVRSAASVGTDADTITPKMSFSTAVLYGKPHVMTEYSVATNSLTYREMTGIANWQMVQGIDRVNSFSFPVGTVSDADLKKHSEQVGRSSYMVQQGRYTTEIGVLYPITSIQGEYVPLNTTIWDAGAFPAYKHDYSFMCMTKNMLQDQLDFIYINDESMQATSIVNDTGAVALHHGVSGLDLKVMVIPEMYTIQTATMEKVKAFYDAGGIVVAIGDLPKASAENGTDPYITSLVSAVFDMGAIGGNGYNKKTNANGGVSIRGAGKIGALEAPLRAAMKEDLLLPEPGDRGIYYMKRAGQDFEMYYLVNNYWNYYYNDTRFRSLGDPSLWDPETGDVTPVAGSLYSYDPVTGYTTIKALGIAGLSSVFVVFDTPELQIAPKDLTLSPLAPLVGDHVTIGVNISNIGNGIAPKVKVNIYDGDPDLGGTLIGGTDTLTIGPKTVQHVDRNWDTTKSPGPREVVAVACLPDGTCVRVQKDIYVNTPPKAAILANRTQAYTYELFNLSSNSTDVDGPLKNISWDLGDGTKAYTKNLTHDYKDNGTYDVSLTVIDSNGTSNRTELKVTVLDRSPVANFTVAPGLVGNYSTVFKFDASGSTDRDGTVVSYVWTFGDGSKVLYQGKVINYTYGRPGTYTVDLTITDNDGSKAQASKSLTIKNLGPLADFTFTPTGGNVTTTFKFSSASKDPDGTIVVYNWSFGDGTYSDKAAPEHRYLNDGTFRVVLRVKDDLGAWSLNISKDIVIQDLPPVAKASPSTQTIKVSVKANFTANGTTDPDDKLTELTFEWDFADGSAKATGMQVSHVYGTAGEYNVTLKVTDPKGASSTVKVHVTVQNPVIPKPKPKPHDNKGATAGIIAIVLIVIIACGIGGFLLLRRKKGGPATEAAQKAPEPTEKVESEVTKEAEAPKDEPPDDEVPEGKDEEK